MPSEYHLDPFFLEWEKITGPPQDKKLVPCLIEGVPGIEKFAPDDVQGKKGLGLGKNNDINTFYRKEILELDGHVHNVARR
jgi:hypothetical protein